MNAGHGHARYQARLDALQRITQRLAVSGVPCRLRRYEPNGAPSPGDRDIMPVIDIANGWRQVKALYWNGELRYSYPYLAGGRWPVHEEGVDRLASQITFDYFDANARGDIDTRGM